MDDHHYGLELNPISQILPGFRQIVTMKGLRGCKNNGKLLRQGSVCLHMQHKFSPQRNELPDFCSRALISCSDTDSFLFVSAPKPSLEGIPGGPPGVSGDKDDIREEATHA